MGAIAVAEGVFWVRLPLPMKLDHVNCYVLDDGDGWTVVDTGFNSKRSRAIWEKLLAAAVCGQAGAPGHRHPSPPRSCRAGGLVPEKTRGRADHHPHRLAVCANADAGRSGAAHRRNPGPLAGGGDGCGHLRITRGGTPV